MLIFFNDLVKTDGKTLISCRDGIQEYRGSEIGLKGDNTLYKVFRSANTIKNFDLVGVPITNDHVDPDKPYMSFGSVKGSEIINAKDESIKKTIEVKNRVKVCKDLLKVINDGKNELSLGYEAKITDVRDENLGYDFTQSDIIPNHLAVVDKGRCGDKCKFNDSNGVKNMDIKTYQEAKDALIGILSLMPQLDAEEQETMKSKMAKAGEKEETDEEMKARKKKEADMEAEAAKKKEKEDMEAEGEKEESKTQKDKAIKKGIADHIGIIAKATDLSCLDVKYVFVDKTANQIMRDCIKTQNDTEFKDGELSIAFKMLKKVDNPHANFGDGGVGTKFKDKEID